MTKSIHLYQDKFTIVDNDIYDLIKHHSWILVAKKYAARYERIGKINGRYRHKCIYLHRELMDCPEGMYVDHINGNGLDNRLENLRICTNSQNNKNKIKNINFKSTSKHKGVHWDSSRNKWHSSIKSNRVHIFIGRFSAEIDAAIAYNEAAKKYHGEFAVLNVIP